MESESDRKERINKAIKKFEKRWGKLKPHTKEQRRHLVFKAIGNLYYDSLIAKRRNTNKRHKKYLQREARRAGR